MLDNRFTYLCFCAYLVSNPDSRSSFIPVPRGMFNYISPHFFCSRGSSSTSTFSVEGIVIVVHTPIRKFQHSEVTTSAHFHGRVEHAPQTQISTSGSRFGFRVWTPFTSQAYTAILSTRPCKKQMRSTAPIAPCLTGFHVHLSITVVTTSLKAGNCCRHLAFDTY
jgi:hypothetical protein